MNQDATSLDRLNDIVVPPDVSWWPLAPGWYLVLALLSGLIAYFMVKWIVRFRANRYRRAALRQLAAANDISGIAEVLRRTALAIVPRTVVAGKSGKAWLDWLALQCPRTMPDQVREQLTSGIYGRPTDQDLAALREYANFWIQHHDTSVS